MKRRIIPALVLIGVGVAMFLKNLDLLPEGLSREFVRFGEKYWPGLLILLGIRVMLAGWNREAARVVGWIIILLVGLWLICRAFTPEEWVI